ncbi:MAG: hypothetical protein ACT4TC_18080 [Myxococcaceae bacterium]
MAVGKAGGGGGIQKQIEKLQEKNDLTLPAARQKKADDQKATTRIGPDTWSPAR